MAAIVPNIAARPASPFQPPNAPGKGRCKAQQVVPRMDRLVPGEPVTFDVEFQTILREGAPKWQQRLGWVAVVNTKCESVLDVFATYNNEPNSEKRYPPREFNVTSKDMRFDNGAVPAQTVEKWLAEIFSNRPVIMHDDKGDREAFQYEQPFATSTILDTQKMYPGKQKLSVLAEEYLHRQVQGQGGHTAIEDAVATMELFLLKQPYDRVAEKAKLEAQGLPTTSEPIKNGGHAKHNQRGGRGARGQARGNGNRVLGERAPNEVASRAAGVNVRGPGGDQRRGRGGRGGRGSRGGRGDAQGY